jgi:hypothetical protein
MQRGGPAWQLRSTPVRPSGTPLRSWSRTLSAICPCTAGNSRTPMNTAGPLRAQNHSPPCREHPAHRPFPLVVAGPGFEPGKA